MKKEKDSKKDFSNISLSNFVKSVHLKKTLINKYHNNLVKIPKNADFQRIFLIAPLFFIKKNPEPKLFFCLFFWKTMGQKI